MIKLAHRLKTSASTERKLRSLLAERPGADVQKLAIDDSIRYTMQLDDEPRGHYVARVKQTLAALETEGHEVVRLKNYWPGDDDYSGINGILMTREGLEWELQFHTRASLTTQADTRPLFEELRRDATSIERKRELFDQMTRAWNAVPIPEGVLTEGALHPNSEIRTRRPPSPRADSPPQNPASPRSDLSQDQKRGG